MPRSIIRIIQILIQECFLICSFSVSSWPPTHAFSAEQRVSSLHCQSVGCNEPTLSSHNLQLCSSGVLLLLLWSAHSSPSGSVVSKPNDQSSSIDTYDIVMKIHYLLFGEGLVGNAYKHFHSLKATQYSEFITVSVSNLRTTSTDYFNFLMLPNMQWLYLDNVQTIIMCRHSSTWSGILSIVDVW